METFKKIFLLFFLMSISSGYALTNYCATPRTSANPSGTYTLNYTCRFVSGTTYEMKLEFANTTGGSANANIASNPGGVNVAANPVWSNGNKTLTYQFNSSSTPTLFVATIFVFIGSTEVRWDLPTDANFAATCASTPVLTTTAATSVGPNGGTMNGNISSVGASNLTSYGFYWSTTNGFADGTGTQVVLGTSNFTGNISSPLSGLVTGTPYYYKAYATNGSGTAYGTQQSFTTTSSNPPPSFGTWTLPAKNTADADFTIVPPTTDSGGAITYTSATPSVATIVNTNQIHIVGAGTSVITLNQAADANHAFGSTTATLTVTVAPPSTAAPTPPARNSWDVISLYSNAYTTLPGAVYQHGTDVTIAGNTTRFISNLLLARLAFPPTNMSAMTTLHIDVYSLTLNPTWFELQGVRVTRNTPNNAWTSLDIPLSAFTGLNLSSISFFDLNNPTGAVPPQDDMYVDNVYLYRPATTLPPTLGAFTLPTKNVGDPDFTITPPTSNSNGAWSYASGTLGVATIVNGNQIHIVGPGSSIITATQAADGSFGQGVTTATFNVNYPDPPASPTQPARNAEDVISLFAAAYADIAGSDFNPNWGQATNHPNNLTTPTYGGDQVKRYLNSGTYQGTSFTAQNLTSINKLHVDIYSYSMTSLRISMINAGGPEAAYTVSLTPNQWNSFNIDINNTNFPGVNLAAVNQIKYDQFRIGAAETGGQVLIVDNLYFYRETNVPPTLGTFAVGPNVTGDADYAITPPTSDSAGAWSYSSSNPLVATIVSGNMIHIVGAGTSIITATQAADGIYASANTTATLTVTFAPLTTAAPEPPARNPWDVISLYSGAFTPYSALACQNIASTSDVQLEGNDTKKMENFNIEIFTFTAANLTPMTTLHMDVYSDDCSAMNIWLLNNGDRNAMINLLPNQWNSIDIPMTTYTNQGLNPNGVFFIKFESLNGAGKTVYFDNLYFYRPATQLPPTLSNFSIPTKAYNDADFAITPPTSDSAGAFSYTSSNPLVATIVNGNMIHIVGGGTSTITANQAADGSYGAGSIAAQFNVTFAPPVASPVPPAREAARVLSLFTGTPSVYANAITAAAAPWSAATMTEVPNGTNTALQLDNFGYLGLTDVTETRFDVSSMSHLYLDVYLNEPLSNNPALSRVNVFLLANNGDFLYAASNLTAGWNTIRIPMGNFAGADLAHAWGLKLESINPATQILIDNVYFANECYTYYEDADSDGYGNPAVSQVGCEGPVPGYVLDNTDCNDAVGAIHPNATEVPYNGVDDDCDGLIDETGTVTTTLLATSCGTTLASIGSLVGIQTVAGHPITGYRIRVTNGAQVQVIERNVPHFTFPNFPSYAYATTYTVEIQLQRAGLWQASWGAPCLVSTPAILENGGAGSVNPSQCGITLAKINTLIATTSLAGVTGYRFRVTNLTDAVGPNAVQTLDRTQNWFSLQMLTRYNYGTQYRIEVAVKTTGTYGGYGAPCEVFSPAVPSLVNCGGTVTAGTSTVAAASVAGATQYRFQITRQSDNASSTIDRSTNYFTFNMVPAATFTAGALYAVRVAVMTSGTWSPFSDACEITAPGGTSKGIAATATEKTSAEAFKATVYPNPFNTDFNIDITTASQEKVLVKVYDMLGKLVESTEVDAADANSMKVGSQFPSGVYNVIVSQDGVVKTQRVIKR